MNVSSRVGTRKRISDMRKRGIWRTEFSRKESVLRRAVRCVVRLFGRTKEIIYMKKRKIIICILGG